MARAGVACEETLTIEEAGTVTKISNNAPSHLLYVLKCVMQTTLGEEIVAAGVPRSRMVLPIAKQCENTAQIVWTTLKFGAPAMIFLHLLAAVGVVGDSVHGGLTFVTGILAAMYFLQLIFFYACLYCPLSWVIIPVALLIKVDNAGDANNAFLKVKYGEKVTAAVDLEKHLFATRLQRENEVTLMVYQQAWIDSNLSTDRFLNEFGICLFHFCEMVQVTTHKASWETFVRTLLWAFLAWLLPLVIHRVASITMSFTWCILNVVFCGMPQKCFHAQQQKVQQAVLARAIEPVPGNLLGQTEQTTVEAVIVEVNDENGKAKDGAR